MSRLIHGTAIAFENCGILLRGPPGSGKSSLALRIIDTAGFGIGNTVLRATLVADDQVRLVAEGRNVMVSCPEQLSGQLEVRGLGIIKVPQIAQAALRLVVDLTPSAEISRMPEDRDLVAEIEGISIFRIQLDAEDPAACAKVRTAICRVKTPSRQ